MKKEQQQKREMIRLSKINWWKGWNFRWNNFKTTIKSLENDIGKTFEVYIDGESDEHEYLLSARKTIWKFYWNWWEIYINDNELEEQIIFGDKYLVTATELAGDKLLAKIIKNMNLDFSKITHTKTYWHFQQGWFISTFSYFKCKNPIWHSNCKLQYKEQSKDEVVMQKI